MDKSIQQNNLNQAQQQGLSYDTKTIIVVLTLIFVYPIGVILMNSWMNWKGWTKLIISLPFYLLIIVLSVFIAILILAFIFGFFNKLSPQTAIKKADCVKACQVARDKEECVNTCLKNINLIPSPTISR